MREGDTRCYFVRAGRVEGVTFLKSGPDDALIEEAKRVFEQHAAQHFEGFEVWVGNRFVYRWQSDEPDAISHAKAAGD